MRCDNARTHWTAQRYGGAPMHPGAQAHMASCTACSIFIKEQSALDVLLAASTDEAPGPGFDTRFFARLAALKAAPQRSPMAWLRWLSLGGVAVAAAVLALVFYPRLHNSSTPQDMAIAMNLDLLQEDVGMLQQLSDVEAYEVIARLPANDPAFDPTLSPDSKVPR